MGFPRLYKTQAILASFVLIVLVISVKRTLSPSGGPPSGQIRIARTSRTNQTEPLSGPEFLRDLAHIDTCPVCFGTDLCEELTRSDVRISRNLYSVDSRVPGVYQVYSSSGVRHWLQPLHSFPLAQHVLRNFEELVCRNGSQMMAGGQQSNALDETDSGDTPCHLSSVASQSFLYSASVDSPTIRNLYRSHLASRRRIPLTSCPTYKLIDALVAAFDTDSDGTLRGSEKAVLITTLSTWPHMAVHRLLRTQGARVPLLGVAGACGRVAVAEAAYKPLSAYLDQPLDVRKGLALQALRLLEGYVDEDPRWVLFTTDVHMDNLVVTNAGQVALLDMSGVMLIDRDLVDGEMEEENEGDENEEEKGNSVCDMKCLMDFYDGLMVDDDATGGKTNPGCLKIKDKLETMFALVCKNVLSDMDEDRKDRDTADQRGLLHSVENAEESTELNSLLRECIDETEVGGRAQAVLNLIELVAADFPDEDEDGIEGDDDGGEETGDADFGDSGRDGENDDNIMSILPDESNLKTI